MYTGRSTANQVLRPLLPSGSTHPEPLHLVDHLQRAARRRTRRDGPARNAGRPVRRQSGCHAAAPAGTGRPLGAPVVAERVGQAVDQAGALRAVGLRRGHRRRSPPVRAGGSADRRDHQQCDRRPRPPPRSRRSAARAVGRRRQVGAVHRPILGLRSSAIAQVRVRVMPATCCTLGTTVGLQVGQRVGADAHHDVIGAGDVFRRTTHRAARRSAWRRPRRGLLRSGSA